MTLQKRREDERNMKETRKKERDIIIKVIQDNKLMSNKLIVEFFVNKYYEECKKKELS